MAVCVQNVPFHIKLAAHCNHKKRMVSPYIFTMFCFKLSLLQNVTIKTHGFIAVYIHNDLH